jgi:hypothetical protein
MAEPEKRTTITLQELMVSTLAMTDAADAKKTEALLDCDVRPDFALDILRANI